MNDAIVTQNVDENYARAAQAITGLTAGLSDEDARATLEHLARLVRKAQERRR